VVGLHDLVAGQRRTTLGLGRSIFAFDGQLVEPGGQALSQTTGVDEDQRGPMLLDQLEQGRMDRRPDAAADGAGCGRAADRPLDDFAERAHVLDRYDDLDLEGLADAGIDDGDRPRAGRRPDGTARSGHKPPQVTGDLVKGTLGRREPDSLRRSIAELFEALERQRQVRAPLGGSEGMDLVDDDRLDPAQRVASSRREHEVERLGGGDEQVGRPAHQATTFVGWGVTGAHAHRRRVKPETQPLSGQPDAHQRGPEILLDVDGQGPQRRKVEQAGASGRVVRRRLADQPIEAPQEGGERLARPGRSQDQGVGA